MRQYTTNTENVNSFINRYRDIFFYQLMYNLYSSDYLRNVRYNETKKH